MRWRRDPQVDHAGIRGLGNATSIPSTRRFSTLDQLHITTQLPLFCSLSQVSESVTREQRFRMWRADMMQVIFPSRSDPK